MDSIVCPLCINSQITLREEITASDITIMYKRTFKVDISAELNHLRDIGLYDCKQCSLMFFYPAATGSELFYEMLQKIDWYYMDTKQEYEYARQYIKDQDSVLEIGCGKGAFARNIDTEHYKGLELSRKAKAAAEQNGVYVVNESVEEHAIHNRMRYDVVCSFQVLEHVANLRSFIESSVACLKPGGILIYSVPSAESFLSILENGILNMPPHHVSWWTNKTLGYVASIFGLEIVEVHNETLEDIHLRVYSSAVTLRGFKTILGLNSKILDRSFLNQCLSYGSNLLARVYEKGLSSSFVRPVGHSVTAVYRKPKVQKAFTPPVSN